MQIKQLWLKTKTALENNLEASLAFQVQTLKLLPLCRFICILLCDHLQLLGGFTRIFFSRVLLRACFGDLLVGPQLLDEVLWVPGVDGPVMHRCWPRHGGQDVVVDRAAVLLQPISVPRVALQPVLHRGPPVLESFLLVAAPGAGGALRGVAEPPPAEPQDLLHIKLFLPRD